MHMVYDVRGEGDEGKGRVPDSLSWVGGRRAVSASWPAGVPLPSAPCSAPAPGWPFSSGPSQPPCLPCRPPCCPHLPMPPPTRNRWLTTSPKRRSTTGLAAPRASGETKRACGCRGRGAVEARLLGRRGGLRVQARTACATTPVDHDWADCIAVLCSCPTTGSQWPQISGGVGFTGSGGDGQRHAQGTAAWQAQPPHLASTAAAVTFPLLHSPTAHAACTCWCTATGATRAFAPGHPALPEKYRVRCQFVMVGGGGSRQAGAVGRSIDSRRTPGELLRCRARCRCPLPAHVAASSYPPPFPAPPALPPLCRPSASRCSLEDRWAQPPTSGQAHTRP